MSRRINHRVYTKLEKFSNIFFLGMISLYALFLMVTVATSTIWRHSSIGEIALLISLLGLASFLAIGALTAIFGIAKDRAWAKWLAILIYGFIGLDAIGSLILIITGNIFEQIRSLTQFILPVGFALIRICIVGIGITLVLQKPKNQKNN